MKLRSILEAGYARMPMMNDAENKAMLHLNAKLVFMVEGQIIRFVRRIS